MISIHGQKSSFSNSKQKKLLISAISFIFIFFIFITLFNIPQNKKSNEQKLRLLVEKAETLMADGYASLNGGTTGGKGGKTVTVSNFNDLKKAVQSTDPMIVIVDGTIKTTDGGDRALSIRSNKTLMGKDKNAKIYGGISISKEKNVIVYNLNIEGVYPNNGPVDGIDISGASTNIWIHHCTIWNAPDGNLDIKKQANYITVSYCKFYYTDKNHPHRLNALISSGGGTKPNDFGFLKVTYHHCWFADNIQERMPRIMYGEVHVYNNYYTSQNNNYCVGVGSYASALIENNYFKKVKDPIKFMYNVYTFILQRNNVFDGTKGTQDGTKEGVILGSTYVTEEPNKLLKDPVKLTSLPYKYHLDSGKNVPSIVQKEAGPQ